MRRGFSKKEKQALFLAADGKSELSGELLPDNWEADHRVSWAAGGPTDVVNGQALTQQENRKKGSGMRSAAAPQIVLREWQREFIAKYNGFAGTDFLLAALPGGGKTLASLAIARDFIQDNYDAKLIVVVPTRNLREQWRDEANTTFRIVLQTTDFNGNLKSDFDGVISTYQSVASNSILFRRLSSRQPTLVIFDEIHHAGDQSAWGTSILEAFEPAKKRLCLSGTPFKSDGQRIPFLRIDSNGFYEIDFRYDWPRAIYDGVVRVVSFHRYSGEVELMVGNSVVTLHTDEDLDEEDQSRRLFGLLHSETFTKDLLSNAHEQLMAVRTQKSDAGALAICIDTNHAIRVSEYLYQITGERPDVILSDDSSTVVSDVKSYRSSNRKWLVAVRMVSEGVDIRRLMVLAYLTNTTTKLFFQQAIGRIMRNEAKDDPESYCFMPDDRRLIEHAAQIEEFQASVVAADMQEARELSESREQSERVPSFTILGSSDAEYAGMTSRGSHYNPEYSTEIRKHATVFGIPESKMAAIFQAIEHGQLNAPHSKSTGSVVEREPEEHVEDQIKKLRTKIQRLVAQIAKKLKVEYRAVHKPYFQICSVPQDQMSKKQLEAKVEWLLKKLASI